MTQGIYKRKLRIVKCRECSCGISCFGNRQVHCHDCLKKIKKEIDKKYYLKNKDKWNTPEYRAREKIRCEKDKIRRKPYFKEYNKMNNEKNNLRNRASRIKQVYGITQDEYNDLLKLQNNVCKICGNEELLKRNNITINFSIDHCHKTGKVRGLLCSKCNMALGLLKDDIKILESAITYLNNN